MKLYIIEDAIKNKVEGVSFDAVGRVVFAEDCVHMGFNIGKSIKEIKIGVNNNLTYKKELNKLNVALDKEYIVLSDEQKLILIKEAIEQEVPGVVKASDGKIAIKVSCKYKGFSVGSWVEWALLGYKGDEKFKSKLLEMNITNDRELVNALVKADIIKEAIEAGIEGIVKLPMNKIWINSLCEYKGVRIGLIISKMMSGKYDNAYLVDLVKGMNIIINRKEREVSKRLIEVINLIDNNDISVIELPNGKFQINPIMNNVGKIIKKVNDGAIYNRSFIEGLMKLNIDITEKVIKKYLKETEVLNSNLQENLENTLKE